MIFRETQDKFNSRVYVSNFLKTWLDWCRIELILFWYSHFSQVQSSLQLLYISLPLMNDSVISFFVLSTFIHLFLLLLPENNTKNLTPQIIIFLIIFWQTPFLFLAFHSAIYSFYGCLPVSFFMWVCVPAYMHVLSN